MRLYDTISSIHMYSIAAKCPQVRELLSAHKSVTDPLQDLQIISDSNREIVSTYAHEDPLIFNAKYGTILNPQVKVSTVLLPTSQS